MTQSFQHRPEAQGGKKVKRTRGEDAQQDALGKQGTEKEHTHDGKPGNNNPPETQTTPRTDGGGLEETPRTFSLETPEQGRKPQQSRQRSPRSVQRRSIEPSQQSRRC